MLSPDVAIVWSAPPECPDESAVRASVASLLGPDAATVTPGAPSFAAVVTRDGSGYDLVVSVRAGGNEEEKRIHGETCAMVAEALAVVVAFAIDPNLAAAHTKAASPAPTAQLAEPESPRIVPTPTPTERPPIALGLRLSGAAGVLPFPSATAGGFVAMGTRPRWELSFSYWPDRRARVGVTGGFADVDVSLIAARPSACWPWAPGSVWELCGGVEGGRMRAASAGPIETKSEQSWWLAPWLGLAARVGFSHVVGVRMRFDVGVPLLRPKFVIERHSAPSIEAFRPWPVLGMLSIEPELRF